MNKQNITKKDLDALRKRLPHGKMAEIAEKEGYTPEYTSDVMRGVVKLNMENIRIVERAQKIAEEAERKMSAKYQRISKFLKKS